MPRHAVVAADVVGGTTIMMDNVEVVDATPIVAVVAITTIIITVIKAVVVVEVVDEVVDADTAKIEADPAIIVAVGVGGDINHPRLLDVPNRQDSSRVHKITTI